nr:ISNCY family transposase [uncultured Sphingomonas sp.]
MSHDDLKRIEILILMQAKVISGSEAQALLNLSRSQVYKLLRVYRLEGEVAIARKARGRPSNRAFPKPVRKRVLQLIEERYADYGPTLIAETLLEAHDVKISAETIRTWMIKDGLWNTNRAARKRLHQPRKRLPRYGDLVQIDGSDHDWFEGRGPRCTAMVMVDDSTGKLQNLKFFPRENRNAYFCSVHAYISAHGRPTRIATDRHSSVWSLDGPTEFTQVLKALGITHSFAYSPQSKGRVERMNRTLQDRLVKAMRAAGISTIEAANAFAPDYIEKHNHRFAKPPACEGNGHRSLEHFDLDRTFSARHVRAVTKNLTFSFEGQQYLIDCNADGAASIGPKVSVEIRLDGTMAVFGQSGSLNVRPA